MNVIIVSIAKEVLIGKIVNEGFAGFIIREIIHLRLEKRISIYFSVDDFFQFLLTGSLAILTYTVEIIQHLKTQNTV